MTQTNLDTAPGNAQAFLVVFTWGDAHVARYTDWTDDLLIGDDTYLSLSKMTVDLPRLQGGTKEDTDHQAKLTLPFSSSAGAVVTPLNTLCRDYEHAPVSISVSELDPDAYAADPTENPPRLLWSGTVDHYKLGGSLVASAQLICVTAKAAMATASGIPMDPTCWWPYRDPKTCGDVNPDVTATVTSISRNVISAPGLVPPASGSYTFGYALFDGLRIDIIDDTSYSAIRLASLPPPEWVGQAVVFAPGCDGKYNGGCAAHANQARFMGLGVKLPPPTA